MSPAEILAALRAPSPSPIVWSAFDDLVRRRVAIHVRDPNNRDDIAQNILYKLVTQLRNGIVLTGTSDGEVIRYLDQMARNARNDLWRSAQRAARLHELADDAQHLASSHDEIHERSDVVQHATALFERLAEAAIEAPPAHSRDDRRAARRQVETLYFSDETVEDIVTRDEGLSNASPVIRRAAVNRAMKRHQRFREAMINMAEAHHAAGKLSDDDRDLIVRMVTELKRR